jgi:hypothetical protein
MNFCRNKSFDTLDTPLKRWTAIMNAVADNVFAWYNQDIFSKKLGALFANYVQAHPGELGELLLLLVMVKQRPPNWEREVENFILRENKNSFALCRVYACLLREYTVGFCSERARHQQRRLAGTALAKHDTGAKHPNTKLIERAVKAIEEHASAHKQLPPAPGSKA